MDVESKYIVATVRQQVFSSSIGNEYFELVNTK